MPVNKKKLEHLSDITAVIALMILMFKLTTTVNDELAAHNCQHFLIKSVPLLLVCAGGFLVIAIFWVAQARILSLFKTMDRTLVGLNFAHCLFLILLALFFFQVALNPHSRRTVLNLAIVLTDMAILQMVMAIYLLYQPGQKVPTNIKRQKKFQILIISCPGCYLAAAAASVYNVYFSFFSMLCAMVCYVIVLSKSDYSATFYIEDIN